MTRSALSLKVRLLAGAALWIAASLVVTGIVLTNLFRAHVERRFELELSITLDQLLNGLQPDGAALQLARPMSDPRFERPYSALYWQVNGPGDALLRSRSLWDRTLPLPDDEPADGELHRHLVPGPDGQRLVAVERKVTFGTSPGIVRAAVAGDLAAVEVATAEFSRSVAAALGTLALGLMLAVMAQVAGGLRPLRRLQDALAELRAGRAVHIGGRFPAEVQPLVDDLNGLLAHNSKVVERARVQAGNLAHALKTPLTILSNAVRTLHPADAAATACREAEMMRRQIDYALARARAAASAQVLGATTAADPQLAQLAAAMHKLHAGRGLVIDLRPSADTRAAVESEDLAEMAGNLLENACKWARHRVEIAVRRDGSFVVITIDDDGPGLPDSEREIVFERGRRFDDAVPGSGLGLAIVRDLAAAYHGSVHLAASPLGGLRAVLRLPAASVSMTRQRMRA